MLTFSVVNNILHDVIFRVKHPELSVFGIICDVRDPVDIHLIRRKHVQESVKKYFKVLFESLNNSIWHNSICNINLLHNIKLEVLYSFSKFDFVKTAESKFLYSPSVPIYLHSRKVHTNLNKRNRKASLWSKNWQSYSTWKIKIDCGK